VTGHLSRYFNRWNLVGLVLLPTLYWGLDLLWHAVLSHSPLLLLANVVIPFAVSVGAFLSWKAWSSKLSQCASLGFLTWLGIYVSGPTYMLLQARLSQGHVWSGTQGPLSDWVFLTLAFPFTTFSFSTYDATLPAPFLTWLGVWLAGRIYAAAPQAGHGGREEGSVLGGLGRLIGGDNS